MTELSFRNLLFRLTVIPLLALCAFLATFGVEWREIVVRRAAATQATALLLQADAVQRKIVDQETGVLGYLAVRDPVFLKPYHEATSKIDEAFASLRASASYSPAFSAKVSAIAQTYQHYAEINRKLLQNEASPDVVVQLLNQQRQTTDSLRDQFAGLSSMQNSTRDANRKALTLLFSRLPGIAVGGAALLVTFLVWYGMTLFREIALAFKKQIQEATLQRDYLQTTLQSIGDGVIVCENYGRITMMNDTAAEITGWAADDAVGRSLGEVFQIIDEETRLPIENPVDKVWRLNAVVTLANHTILIRRDGAEIPIDDSGAPIRNADGALSGVVLVFRSVAEQRQAANLLRQSQEHLQAIYNTSLSYIGILDPQGRLLDCNRTSLEFAGNKREELVGEPFWECPWFANTPGMPERVRAAISRAVEGESTRMELALIRPNGESMRFDFSLNPVFNAEGKVIYLVPEGRDINDLKRAESALIQNEKLAAVGRLATSIAHEINNPLEAATNLLYLARAQSLPPKAEAYLEAADHELHRVSVIANQTLRFHKQASSPEPIQPDELLSTVLGIFEGKLRNARISVEMDYRTREPIVCFAGDVRQVLNNLVGNAIDSMSRGGRLLIRSQSCREWVTGRRGIVITVADTGSGIERTNIRRIFDPFFTTKGIGGAGLGLWVSQEVVDRHSGTLRVRSIHREQRSGTVFRLFLPMI